MVPTLARGLAAPGGGAQERGRSDGRWDELRWRLLIRIAQVRWGVIAFAVVFALVGSHRGAPTWALLVLVAVAAGYNASVTLHRRLPGIRSNAMTTLTVAGDFAWVTGAAALLTANEGGAGTAIGYVVVGAECGLLLRRRGVLLAVCASFVALLAIARTVGNDLSEDLLYESATVAVSAVFAAVGAAELRAQQRELLETTRALAEHARTDHLTGLGNATAVAEKLDALASRAFGLLLIDVDRMRWTNALYGHKAGDEALLALARLLAGLRSDGDLASRIGEDKFVLVLPSADEPRTRAVAEEVRAATHGVAVSAGQLRVSVGCAWNGGFEEGSTTLARADDALFAAKARGGDRVVVEGRVEGGGRMRLRDAVESALKDQRGVYSVYQPIVRLHDRTVVGWEALSRPHDWPADADVEALFLTAHRIGRARDLDWRCRRAALWDASRLAGILFVNVNVAALLDPVQGVDQMVLLCEWAQRAPTSVVLELSEHDATPDLRRLRDVLADYRAAGFRFALDDIGEGQTTLELVLAARPEFLKLARPLVQAARASDDTRLAVRALVGFAHDVGSTVVAEGVEDEADRHLCLALQFDLGQGWLFGRPLPADRVRA